MLRICFKHENSPFFLPLNLEGFSLQSAIDSISSIVFQLWSRWSTIIGLRGRKAGQGERGDFLRGGRNARGQIIKEMCVCGGVSLPKGLEQHLDGAGELGSLGWEQMLCMKELESKDWKKIRKGQRNCYKWKLLLRYCIKLFNIRKHPFCEVVQK